MIRQHVKFAILILLIIWVSVRYSALYSVFGIKPDLILILLIRKSIQDPRPQISLAWGFSSGLIIDYLVGDVIGISSLTYSIVCFSVSFYKRTYLYIPSYKRTLLYVYSVSFSSLLIYSVTASYMPFVNNLSLLIVPSAVYTMTVAVIIQTLKPTR